MSETMQARLETIIFHNPDNHYVVAEFCEITDYHYFTATGHIPEPLEDQVYELTGTYVTHPRYGKQFKIETITRVLPSNNEAIIRFLCSEAFPGIGKKTAQTIFETLGEECLQIIRENDQALLQVKGLNEKKRQVINEGIRTFEGFNDTYAKLVGYGLPANKIALLQKHYDDILDVLEQDCFLPYYEIYGFGYKSACLLADGMQMDSHDTRRQDAFLYEQLRNMCMQSGDTYVHVDTLLHQYPNADPALILESLERLNELDSVTLDHERIYPFGLYEDEIIIAKEIAAHNFPIETIDEEELEDKIREVEFGNAITYDEIQKEAILSFFHHSMMILNGGPGTGKTTIIKGILEMCEDFYPSANIQLCAPTGRAANRMSQLSQYNAKTIHSLLRWNMEDNSFAVELEEETLDCDFLIVDECSMVDTHLFATLLKVLPSHCRIVLIGDEDQLESVGPGKVLQDLLDSDCIPTIRLEKIYRQQHGSGIVTLAGQIRKEQPVHYQSGVTFLEPMDIAATVLELAAEYDTDDCQVLAPMYKGNAGIDEINGLMQTIMNPPSKNKKQFRAGTTTFRVDDKVMLLKNMPENEVYNGDIGRIIAIERNQIDKRYVIVVDFETQVVSFDHDYLYYLKHAYCISIHKSQGNEYDRVICIIEPQAARMMNKRLLYTAISRAKKELFLVGSKSLFENSVRLKQRHIRQTTLPLRIQEEKR